MTSPSPSGHPIRPYTPESFRACFPIFEARGNEELAYLDNAATSQKPQEVIDAISDYYGSINANIHRGVYRLSMAATDAYDAARSRVAAFLGARTPREIVFVRGATEGINLVAQSFLRPRLRQGDEILLTETEHHANFVPWQMVAEATGAHLRLIPLCEDQSLDLEVAEALLTERTRMLAVVHGSNATGNLNPVETLIGWARALGIPVLVDACQSAVHGSLNVEEMDCDFLVFSGHKLYAPTGIGVLYGKEAHLLEMPPYQGGGDMIEKVALEATTFAAPPERFEAGTPHISGAIALAAAIDFLEAWDPVALRSHEQRLLARAVDGLRDLPGMRLLGSDGGRLPIVSFLTEAVHPHDIATFLDAEQVAIRAGHHCCQPLMRKLGVAGTSRASFAPYNTVEEVDRLIATVHQTIRFFQ